MTGPVVPLGSLEAANLHARPAEVDGLQVVLLDDDQVSVDIQTSPGTELLAAAHYEKVAAVLLAHAHELRQGRSL